MCWSVAGYDSSRWLLNGVKHYILYSKEICAFKHNLCGYNKVKEISNRKSLEVTGKLCIKLLLDFR